MNRFLLDTHAFLWLQTEPARLGDFLATAQRADTVLLLSPASSWEISIKYGIGKLPLPQPPAEYVPDRMRVAGVGSLPVTHTHTLTAGGLPPHHRDPFDRLLVAQSLVESIPIVTSDPLIRAYDADLVWLGT